MAFSNLEQNLILGSDNHLDMHTENIISGLVLIALLTYFYNQFSRLIQPGGDNKKHGSPIYYSSPAAV